MMTNASSSVSSSPSVKAMDLTRTKFVYIK